MKENLETFLKIVETGSLSGASRELFAAQSTVSSRLKRLEKELGFILINREKGRKTVKLTLKGKEFVPIANRLLSNFNEVHRLSNDEIRYNVNFSCPESICCYLLKDFICDLKSEGIINLNVTSLWNDLTYHKMEIMEDDVGLVTRVYHTNSLHQYPFYREALVAVYNSDYSDYREVYNSDQLSATDGIYFDWGDRLEMWTREHFETPDNFGIRIDTPGLIQCLLKEKQAWAIVPFSIYRQLKATQSIEIISLKDELPEREIYLLIPSCNRLFTKEMIQNFCIQLIDYVTGKVNNINQDEIGDILNDDLFADL